MIDLHCHVLAGIDDGPDTIEGSIALARAAANMGVRILVATPHVSRRYPNDCDTIARTASALAARLAVEEIPLELRRGAEIAVPQLSLIDPSELPRLSLGGGPWLLLESPLSVESPDIAGAVAELQRRGFGVVLAHPERCPAFHSKPALLESLVRAGALTSITAGAFVGRFGRRVRDFAFELVRTGMAHSVASDAHDRAQRPPGMTRELQQAGLGGLSDWLTREVPAAILAGADIPARPAAGWSAGRARRRAWWWRLAGRSRTALHSPAPPPR